MWYNDIFCGNIIWFRDNYRNSDIDSCDQHAHSCGWNEM